MAFLDFFKPHWKHSNPAVRASSIRALEDDQEPLLLTIALEDTDAGNRLIAARRIKDSGLLKKLRDQTRDKNIKEIAQKHWVETQIVIAKTAVAQGQSLADLTAALEAVGEDQRALEDIARHAAEVEIRRLAFPKLTHASAIQAVALTESDDGLALKALAKISRDGYLESLGKGARSKAVRIAAKERLKSSVTAKGMDAAAINRAKLALVLGVADKIALALEGPASGIQYEEFKRQLDDANDALQELIQAGTMPDEKKLTQFQNHKNNFTTLYTRWQQERTQKIEKEKCEIENQNHKEEICLRLEVILQSDDMIAASVLSSEGAASELRQLRDEFHTIGPVSEHFEVELQKRFRGLIDKIERKAKDQEAQIRREGEEKEHGGRLAELVAQAESLTHTTPAEAIEKFRELRKEWNKAFNAAGHFASKEELRQKYEAAVASTQSALEDLRNENLSRMRLLLPELEALLESSDMVSAEKNFKGLNNAWKNLNPQPQGPEADELHARYISFIERFREAQDWLRWSNHRSKQLICDKLEALLPQEERKSMVFQFKELQAEWKSLGPVPWDSSEALWDRYNKVGDALYEKCREYFAELDVERESNLKIKEEICARLETLLAAEDVDWREAMEVVKEAQGSWKTLGAVPKAQSEAIWNRFRAACNIFFERKDKHNQDNLSRKLELVILAESLQDSTDWKSAGTQIKQAQENWKTLGAVPREHAEAIWNRFHSACEKFFTARKVFLEKLDQEKPQNLVKKEALCVAMESLDALADDFERFERIKEAQSAWKEIGPVVKEMEEPIWNRFRKPVDAYFEMRKGRLAEEQSAREENGKIKEDICIEAESITNSIEWKETIEKIKSLQERWKATGPAPRESDRELWKRFRTACDSFFDRLKENSAKRDVERNGNLIRKTDLCFLVEAMVKRELTDDQTKAREEFNAKSLPVDIARFKVEGIDWEDNTEKIKAIQREWKKIGPVPRDLSDAIWERFNSACDQFFEERRVALGLPPEDPQISLEKKLDLIKQMEDLAEAPGEGMIKRIHGIQRDFRRTGAVPPAQSDFVLQRFTEASEKAFAATKSGSKAEPEAA